MTPIAVAGGLVGQLMIVLLCIRSVCPTADLKTRSILPDVLPNRVAAIPTQLEVADFADDHIVQAVILATITTFPQINARCRDDINRTFAAIGRREAWAIAMFDASVKLPTGVEHGSVYQFGNFDECMVAIEPALTAAPDAIGSDVSGSRNVDADRLTAVQPQYCLAEVHAVGYSVRTGANRHFQLRNETTIQWGVCLPASCTPSDTVHLLSAWTGHASIAVDAQRCHRPDTADANDALANSYSALDVLVACIIMAMLSMVVFCSGFHAVLWLWGGSRGRTLVEQIIMSFSLFENIQKLGQASRDELGLSSLNGIKALSMMCIIAGHAMLFMVGGPQLNADFYAREIHLVRNAFLLNSPLLVDTFLLLSGFLFAHLVLVELEKRRGRVNFGLLYVFRYVRLTPAYLAVIAVYATWLPRLGSGPLWQARMSLEQERCRRSWWLNVLYVNNYVGTDDICMFQSWYLAADTQLFVLAPLVVYPLWRWRRTGLAVLGSLTVVSVLVPLAATLAYDTDPSLLPYADEVEDITTNSYFIDWYIKTHMRATSYLFGILAGFLVHYVRENDIKLGRRTVWLLWLTSCAAGLASMCAIVAYVGNDDGAGHHGTSAWSRALYAGLHRLGWSYATAWLVLACALGHAGPVRQLLSARALVPLSRLTYCAYLTNGLVELYQAASVRTPKYMSTINMLGETTAHVLLTFIGALVLCLLFESPIHGLEKIFLRQAKTHSSTGGASQNQHNHQQKPHRSSDSCSLGPSTESDSTS